MKNTLFVMILFLIVNGCSDTHNKAVMYCIDHNGTVIQSESENEEICQYQEEYEYDDGLHEYTLTCELYTFYNNGVCDSLEEEIVTDTVIRNHSTPKTIGETYHEQALRILERLDHTGYTHKKENEGPFVLHPNYTHLTYKTVENKTELNNTIESYNLFLDCSGFVGYYVVQGISELLYSEINTCYGSSRPLAADFADTFKNAEKSVTDSDVSDATLLDMDENPSYVHWGRVTHIKDAKPGDIIVYKHPENIIHYGDCDNKVTGNTGHVLFIMDEPKPSTKYNNEWLVRVADSTTKPHSKDSRYSNKSDGSVKHKSIIYDKSKYDDNYYTAWTKRYNKGDSIHWYEWFKKYKEDDWLELCDTEDYNTFHRRCEDFDEKRLFKIHPQTIYRDSSTGIGIGYIYIDNDMKHYRVKKNAKATSAEVYIGRPVIYQP